MKNKIVLQKMLIYIDKVLLYVNGFDYAMFNSNNMLVDACVFNISQLGELVRALDSDFTFKYNYMPWRQINGLRNRIVHDYEGVNIKVIWEIIAVNLVPLRLQIVNILSDMQ